MRRVSIFGAVAALALASGAAARPAPADLVDPFMGTAGDRGQLSPAAAAPFGMVQLAPDTDPANHIGYDRGARHLRGFSFTRAQGVGCHGGGGDLLVSLGHAGEAGPWTMDKASERAGAGWYRVRYGAVTADLAAGQSVSIARFRLAKAGPVEIALDPRHSYARHVEHAWLGQTAGDLRLSLANATVCDKGVYQLGVAARLLLNGRPLAAPGRLAPDGVLRFTVQARAGDTIELRSALSSIDAASARATLDSELGALTLAQLTARTRVEWNAALSRIGFDGTGERSALFYTALFRTLQMPARVDDARGAYRTSAGEPRQAPAGRHRYAGWSLWDNYRTQVPLLALAAPDVARDVSDSLAELFVAGKAQWAGPTEPFLSVRTEHAGIALLDLRRKGLGTADLKPTLAAMARETGELPGETPDQRLELAYDQWAVAELARDLGDAALARDFTARWQAYRPMWRDVFRDPGTDGDTVKARGLYQGTIWQYRWAPVFDLAWLRGEALGADRFDRELAAFFGRQLFNMTNEPDIHAPFLFALGGDPQAGDALVARLRDEPIDHWYDNRRKLDRPFHQPAFALAPGFADGMDDDGGAMSAWYVWASIGLYPLVPGEPWYIITAPAAPRVVLDLGQGRTFTIARKGPPGARKVAAIHLNGRRLEGRRLAHADLLRGGVLTIEVEE